MKLVAMEHPSRQNGYQMFQNCLTLNDLIRSCSISFPVCLIRNLSGKRLRLLLSAKEDHGIAYGISPFRYFSPSLS